MPTPSDAQLKAAFPNLSPLKYPEIRSGLYSSVEPLLIPTESLAVEATSAATIKQTTGVALTTRISLAASYKLAALKELAACGLVTGLTFHDADENVTVEVIPGPGAWS